jgi:hypothetical protein
MDRMPDASSSSERHSRPLFQRLLLAAASAMLLVACAGGPDPAPGASAPASGQPEAGAIASEGPLPSGEVAVDLCSTIANVEVRLAALRAVELRLPNRVALDIELAKLQAAFSELRQVELGSLEAQLRSPLKRLGYRLAEVELAVEDFRTNPRPQRAVPHVEEDAQALSNELAAFAILARC